MKKIKILSFFISFFFFLIACTPLKLRKDRTLAEASKPVAFQCFNGEIKVSGDQEGMRECARRFFVSQEVLLGNDYSKIVVRDLAFASPLVDSSDEIHISAQVGTNTQTELKSVFLILIGQEIRVHEKQDDKETVQMSSGGIYCEGRNVGGEWSCARRMALHLLSLDGYEGVELSSLKLINSYDDPEDADERVGYRTYTLEFKSSRNAENKTYHVGLKYEQNIEYGTDDFINYTDNTVWDRTIRSLKSSSLD